MFEKPVGKEEKDRSRVIMIISGAAVAVVIALIVVVTQLMKPTQAVQMERVYAVSDPETTELGAALLCPPENVPQTEVQSYVQKISFLETEKLTGEYENFKNKYGRIITTVKNDGDRVIQGLQLRMVLYGLDCQVIKEKVLTFVPEKRSELKPGEALLIDMSIDKIPDPAEIKTMRVEPYGLKLK